MNTDFWDKQKLLKNSSTKFIYFFLNLRVYQDKLAGIQKQVQQLRDGTHVEYVKQLKKLEQQQKNQ